MNSNSRRAKLICLIGRNIGLINMLRLIIFYNIADNHLRMLIQPRLTQIEGTGGQRPQTSFTKKMAISDNDSLIYCLWTPLHHETQPTRLSTSVISERIVIKMNKSVEDPTLINKTSEYN